jgi:hypothetical protein
MTVSLDRPGIYQNWYEYKFVSTPLVPEYLTFDFFYLNFGRSSYLKYFKIWKILNI